MLLGMFTVEVDLGNAAAWVQGIGSLLAVFVAVGIAVWGHFLQDNRGRIARQRARLLNAAKIANIERSGLILISELGLGKDIDEARVSIGKLRTALTQINRACSLVDQLIVQESSAENIIYHATAYIVAGEQISFIFNDVTRMMVDGFEGAPKDALINKQAVGLLKDQIELMESAQIATQKYCEELSKDPAATPGPLEIYAKPPAEE